MTATNFPLFDGHMHYCQLYLDEVVETWNENHVIGGINLWGSAFGHFGDQWSYSFDYTDFLEQCAKRNLLDRFVQFYWPDWRKFGSEPEVFVPKCCKDLRRYAAMGCRGLKVWKDLGMFTRFTNGTPAFIDDPRLTPIWETCVELSFPISIHTADPSDKWETRTQTGISRSELYERRDRVLAAYPKIRFILCHSANDIEDLGLWAKTFDQFPHVNADLRPTETSPSGWAEFLDKYANRFYIGPDLGFPTDRRPDHPWSKNEVYDPWRRSLTTWNIKPGTREKIAWRNGARDFIRAKI